MKSKGEIKLSEHDKERHKLFRKLGTVPEAERELVILTNEDLIRLLFQIKGETLESETDERKAEKERKGKPSILSLL